MVSDAVGDAAGIAHTRPLPRRGVGYLAHAYTASGLLLVVFATHLVLQERYALALVALVLCIVIDSTDGVLARRLQVKQSANRIDGRRLDDIVDFLSFVFVPLLLALRAGLLLEPAGAVAATAMVASVFGFSRVDAKQDEKGFFVGFPSYWNVVVGYLWLFETPQLFNTVVILALAVLVLVPVRFLYLTHLPNRKDRRRHYLMGAIWGVVSVVALLTAPGTTRDIIAVASLAYPAYYLYCSVRSDLADRRAQGRAGAG
jgi:phosphatidylcholine synthase